MNNMQKKIWTSPDSQHMKNIIETTRKRERRTCRGRNYQRNNARRFLRPKETNILLKKAHKMNKTKYSQSTKLQNWGQE